MFQPGTVLEDTFQILEEIGAGGMGIVYKAYHLHLQKEVVVKKIKGNFVGKVNARGEVDILKRLHHTYLPQIYDFIQYDDEVYTVMEYIRGYDLNYYMRMGWRFTEEQLLQWLRQLAEVLQYLHSRKPPIIHSDIKPANIMITEEGNVCLIDFNISFNEEDGKLEGFSPYFSSPEQYELAMSRQRNGGGERLKLDARSDIYSLGATFYYLISGILPGTLYEPVPLRNMSELPYSEGLRCMTDKMMSRSRDQRYQSAEKLLRAAVHVERQSVSHRRKRLAIQLGVIAAATLITVGVVVGVGFVRHQKVERAEEKYNLMVDAYADGDAALVRSMGNGLLTAKEYHSVLARNREAIGSIYDMLGVVCLGENEYDTALGYFESALETDGGKAVYYKDYAVALAKLGEYREAELTLKEAEIIGIDDEDMAYVKAQIYWGEKRYEEAYQEFCRVLADAVDTSARNIQREYGCFCFEYGSIAIDDERQSLWEEALEAFQSLTALPYAGFVDYYDLAILYEALGEYHNGREVLLDMKELFGEDYRIYAHLAVAEYEMEVQESGGEYDFSKAYECCKKARELYGSKEDGNAEMETVRAILERIGQ